MNIGSNAGSRTVSACCGSASTEVGADTDFSGTREKPPGLVIAALGFSSAEAYGVYVSGLTESEFSAHIVLVFNVIKQLGLD